MNQLLFTLDSTVIYYHFIGYIQNQLMFDGCVIIIIIITLNLGRYIPQLVKI